MNHVLPRDARWLPFVPYVIHVVDLPLSNNDFVDVVCDARKDFIQLRIGNASSRMGSLLEEAARRYDPRITSADTVIIRLD